MRRVRWINEALCATSEIPAEAWDGEIEDYREEVIEICARCPVRKACYNDAVKDRASIGIRAGVLFVQRSELEHETNKFGPKVPAYIEVPKL